MRNICVVMAVAGLSFASPAHADQAGWCAAYARDFADARASDKTLWQHKYDIANKACLDEQKQPDAPAVKKVETSSTPQPQPKSAQVAAAKPEVVAPPVTDKKMADKKLADKSKSTSGAPEPGSAEWNAYCAKKYSSFDAKTGMYLSLTRVQRKCLYTG